MTLSLSVSFKIFVVIALTIIPRPGSHLKIVASLALSPVLVITASGVVSKTQVWATVSGRRLTRLYVGGSGPSIVSPILSSAKVFSLFFSVTARDYTGGQLFLGMWFDMLGG